jgi:hypothetical protein
MIFSSTRFYEIALQDKEAAFDKLDEAKAYVFKSRLLNGHTDYARHDANDNPLNLDVVKTKLCGKGLLIDYMVTPDTLYAFVLNQSGLRLLRKR